MLNILVLLSWSTAQAFQEPTSSICISNLSVIGTVINRESFWSIQPDTNPQHPQGRIYTRITINVERNVVDKTNAVINDTFKLVVPGGQIGDVEMTVPERPQMDIGDRYGVVMKIRPQAPYPLMVDWDYMDSEVSLLPLLDLQDAWEAYCE